MFGAATSDPIGKKRREIADLYARAQVAERAHRYAEARTLRARAKAAEAELHRRVSRRESITAHEHRPPVRPPGVRPATYDKRFHGRMYRKRPGFVPPYVMPARRVPRRAPGPNNVIPPHPGVHRLPNAKWNQHPGRVLTEGGIQRTRPLTRSELAELARLDQLVSLWTRRAEWAEVNAPPRAIFAWSQVDRYLRDRSMILRRAGQMKLWQRDVARHTALQQRVRAVPGVRGPGGQRSAAGPGPGRPPGMLTPYERNQRAAVAPVIIDIDVYEEGGQWGPSPRLQRRDLPLPGTGPTPIRMDPGPGSEREDEGADREDEGADKRDEGAGEEPGFFSKWGLWLFLGAVAVGGAYAYSRSKKKGGTTRPSSLSSSSSGYDQRALGQAA